MEFLLSALMTAVFSYVLYCVVRAAVEAGMRRALTPSLLRPTVQELIGARETQRPEAG